MGGKLCSGMLVNYRAEYALLKGYRENSDNLAKYLIRESKKAEKEFIDNEEFFNGLNNVIKLFHGDIDNQYYKRMNEVSMIKSLRQENGQSTKDLESQIFPKKSYSVFLPRVTNSVLTGNLPFQEILFLESEVSRAQEFQTLEAKKEYLADAISILKDYAKDLSESEYWAKHIAKTAPDIAQRELFKWQSDYNNEKPFNPDVWERYNKHFLALFQNSTCNEIAYELKKTEKDFEYACLAYWKNTKKEINGAISDISNAIAVIKMLEWLETLKSKVASKESDLSAFEIALKHYHLYIAKKENLTGGQLAEKYKGFKSIKNIELAYNRLFKIDSKKGNKSQLKKVHDSLNEHPDVQRAIQNEIDKLN